MDELARALTDRERRALLERIAKSLSVEDDDRRRIIHGELRRERRTDLIASDMGRLTFWEKARLWFRRWMSGQSDEEVFVRFRLRQARDRVRGADEVFVDFDNRAILEGVPEAMRTLCRCAVTVRDFFTFIWHDTETLRGVLDYLLAKRVPDAKRSLNQFCATHELQEVFRTTESRSQLKQLVLDRVSDYINRIPPSVIEEFEAGLKPLYMLKDLVLFDFDAFFMQFQATEEEARSSDENVFHSASAHRVLDHLEHLYLALYNTSQITEEGAMYPEVLNYYFASRSGELPDDDVLAIPDAPRAPELRAAIDRLVEEARRLRQGVPLTDIIRFFRDDPYYRFLAYIPSLKLRDFYYSNLKIEVLQELDRRFKDIRMGVIGQIIQEVFSQGLLHFEYFHPEIQAGIKRAGIGQLQVYRSLQVIHTFMQSV
ncbi:MAG: DUF5312 domain-containing protein, partial [Spirochaetales bacterium]|nr:DUF5312 domain-containing protein [Spirochaetales bacterium]